MAGKVSQPCPPNHFSQQVVRTQKQEKWVRYLWSPIFSTGDSLCLGCPALPWVCLSPHGKAKPVALPESAGSEQRHRLHWNFCILIYNPEGGDVLSLKVDDAATMKKISTASSCAELNFYRKLNPSGAAGRPEFPCATDPYLKTRAACAEHPLVPTSSAIPTSALPGALAVPGCSVPPGKMDHTWQSRHKWIPELWKAECPGVVGCLSRAIALFLQKEGTIPGSKQPKLNLWSLFCQPFCVRIFFV